MAATVRAHSCLHCCCLMPSRHNTQAPPAISPGESRPYPQQGQQRAAEPCPKEQLMEVSQHAHREAQHTTPASTRAPSGHTPAAAHCTPNLQGWPIMKDPSKGKPASHSHRA